MTNSPDEWLQDNQDCSPNSVMTELNAAAIEAVAGGLNPQPEPPGRSLLFTSPFRSLLAF